MTVYGVRSTDAEYAVLPLTTFGEVYFNDYILGLGD